MSFVSDVVDSIFGGGGTEEMADATVRQAEILGALGTRALDAQLAEQQRTQGQRDEAVALSGQVARAQIAGMEEATRQARDLDQYHRTTFRPVEARMASDAINFDTPERRAEAADQAGADVAAARAAGRQATTRSIMRRGGSVNGARMLSLQNADDIGGALADATARNSARRSIEGQGWARMADVSNLGRGIASSQATQQQIATQAGASGVGALQGQTGINTVGSGMMATGFGQAMGGAQGAGGLYAGMANMYNNRDIAILNAASKIGASFAPIPGG